MPPDSAYDRLLRFRVGPGGMAAEPPPESAPAEPASAADRPECLADPRPEPPPAEPEDGEHVDDLADEGPPDDTPAAAESCAMPGEPWRALGHDHGVFYFLSDRAKQVLAFKGADLGRDGVLSQLAPWAWWKEHHGGEDGKVNTKAAVEALMTACFARGAYDPDLLRGRGAWLDGGKSVLHLGDRLIVDGRTRGLSIPGSRYIYELGRSLTLPDAAELPVEEARKLLGLCRRLSWERPVSGTLVAGWIAVAPVCGGVKWRPSGWITGGTGTGKSTLQNIIATALGGMALHVQGDTSEAGIRQALANDALPVVFDEAEREDAQAQARFKGVLNLVRQSSSEGGGRIVKGTQNQTGARSYRVRSSFMFSSINVGLQHQADENRVTVFALRKPKVDVDGFAKLERDIAETLTPEFAAGLLARSLLLLPVIRDNAETFARAVAEHLNNRRAGDHLGALLAGPYSLISDERISPADAEEYVARHRWAETAPEDVQTDEARLLAFLMQSRVRVTAASITPVEASLGALVEIAAGIVPEPAIPRAIAEVHIKQAGIRLETEKDKHDQPVKGFAVANNHPGLEAMLKPTAWATAWHRTLSRLPGATNTGNRTMRFGPAVASKGVFLPMALLGAEEAPNATDDA